ncbi:MAG TPA: lipase maturation factor family protein [Bryobacteraceae bacterium]|nr:lipase maturation factor family protein [Bryobacteraceae bacterium]
MPDQPLVIFDGRCGFCRIWIEYWQAITDGRVAYAPSQEVGSSYPQIPAEEFGKSVQLVTPSGEVLRGARAVFVTLTYAPGMAWLLWVYQHVPGVAPVSEAAYRWIAAHRTFGYHLTRLTFGKRIRPLPTAQVEWLFLRALAAIYFVAFASLGVQVAGLIGDRGILPASRYLAGMSKALGARAYWDAPTIFWLAHGTRTLEIACWAGAAIAVLLFSGMLAGYLERAVLVLLYVLYLSLCTVGQDFLSFQWDSLLLEAGFLAIFLGNSKIVVWLFRWLLFRLMFLSGAVKLTSQDPVWRNLTALAYHYLTQPLPTPLAWYMYQLPLRFQQFSTAFVLAVELVAPFLFFAPRPWRFWGARLALFLQVMIFLTGNYTFFNLLTMALCLFLIDDNALAKLHLRSRLVYTGRSVAAAVAAVLLILSVSEVWETFFTTSFEEGNAAVRLAAPFQIANTYGLFATMTTTRPEIIVEGSNDGVSWLPYVFPYKPGALEQPPHWVAPYQPRLDWQMWFAALTNFRSSPWFVNFMVRLLQGSPAVSGLLAKNPFPTAPPRYVRAELFDYRFTNFAERRATGDWWSRTPHGLYFPAISLQDVQQAEGQP